MAKEDEAQSRESGRIPPEAADMTPVPAPEAAVAGLSAEEERAEAAPVTVHDRSEDAAEEPVREIASPEPPRTEPPPPVASAPAKRRGGAIGLIFGGIVAGAIGFGAAWYLEQMNDPGLDIAGEFERRDAQIAALEAELAELRAVTGEGPDLTPLETATESAATEAAASRAAVEELRGEMAESMGSLQDSVAALDTRLTDLEQLPQVDGSLSSAAVEAYEREIAALREETAEAVSGLEAQTGEIETGFEELRTTVEAALADLETEAEALEQQSEEAAAAAAARTALAEIQGAVSGGAPYADALADLQASGAVEVPEVLAANAETGVASLPALREAFPEAARAALATVRSEESGGGLGAFLERQLNVRSVEPREGDDPDAVLSRAGAAVDAGRIDAALQEIAGLPETAAAALSDWTGAARARVEAQDAIDQLTQTLTTN